MAVGRKSSKNAILLGLFSYNDVCSFVRMDGWWYNRFVKAFVILGFGFLLVKYYCGGGRYMKDEEDDSRHDWYFSPCHYYYFFLFSRFIRIYLTHSLQCL